MTIPAATPERAPDIVAVHTGERWEITYIAHGLLGTATGSASDQERIASIVRELWPVSGTRACTGLVEAWLCR